MASDITRILKRAAGEIGYSRWNDPKKGTKYARETQPVLWKQDKWLLANGIAYCDIFITWVFWKEGLLDILPGKQSYNTDYRASAGQRENAIVDKKEAKPGDVAVFDWNWATPATNHVGIIEKILPSGNFQTIEGNTSKGTSGSQSNGGGVYRRTRRASQVRYVIRPRYSKVSTSKTSTAVDKKKDGTLTVDGRYGIETGKALQRFLNSVVETRKLKIDGKSGTNTWKSLQEYLAAPYIDGKISRQSYKASELGNSITQGWEYTGRGSKGSQTVVLLQRWVGVNADGVWYEGTTSALQRKLNEHGVGMKKK